MGNTWQFLLTQFARSRNQDFRSDPERQEALIEQIASTMQATLEKLRDEALPK